MVIAHNMLAMNAQRQFNMVGNSKKKSMEKLSLGYRINKAADDAAGLSISEKMRRQIRGLNQGARNTQDGISLLQVADGALAEVHDMIHRITELSIQAANGTNADEDRQAIQHEINQIIEEIDRISDTTEFNTRSLFKNDGSYQDNKIIGYETKVEYVENESANEKSITCSVTGQSSDTMAKKYSVTGVNATGLVINSGEGNISWSDIKSTNGNAVDLQNIQSGTYNFSYKGMNIQFTTDSIKDDELKTALSKLNWQTKENKGSGRDVNLQAYVDYYQSDFHPNAMIFISSTSSTGRYPDDSFIIKSDEYRTAAIKYSEFKDETGKKLDMLNPEPGTYTYYFDTQTDLNAWGPYRSEIQFTLEIGEDNTLPIYNINFSSMINRYNTIDNAVTLASKSETTPKTITVDTYTSSLKYTTKESNTEKIETKVPIYEKVQEGTKSLWIQSGAEAGDGMYLDIDDMNTEILGINQLNCLTEDGAQIAIKKASDAVDILSSQRTKIGAQYNRLEHTYANVTNTSENTQAAESRIRDTDMAKEAMKMSKQSILEQVGQSIMAQANQSNQHVLNLLQG